MSTGHTITVVGVPTDDSDDLTFELGGRHDLNCEVWRECQTAWHRHPKNADIVGDEWGNERVGAHAYIDGDWMVPSGECGYFEADLSGIEDWLICHHAEIGSVWNVSVDWDGDWWFVELGDRVLNPEEVSA